MSTTTNDTTTSTTTSTTTTTTSTTTTMTEQQQQQQKQQQHATLFPHRLPLERLGQSHDSLDTYRAAIQHFVPPKTKEYSLVMVTTTADRRILLGHKHRGFGSGMYNSFGGKLELNETALESAVRELEEETGIVVPPPYEALQKVARHEFTFSDGETLMLVHVYRLNVMLRKSSNHDDSDTGTGTGTGTAASDVTTNKKKDDDDAADNNNEAKQQQQQSNLVLPLDPDTIRGCDEITPFWVDDWHQLPLHNMFADDSLWVPHILLDTTSCIYMEGYFHFLPGGQETNSIQHYYMDIQPQNERNKSASASASASLSSPASLSLERRLFHELHRNEISSPSIKEFKEGYAFMNATRTFFGKHNTFDVVLDVAGGHGALAALYLLTKTCTKHAVVIDPAKVGNVVKAWGHLLSPTVSLEYRHECLRTGLAAELDRCIYQLNIPRDRILVVACHACQHLSDEILQIATSKKYGVAAAVMPCCQKDTVGSWKSFCKNTTMAMPIATVMDLLLAGKAMSWDLAYDVRIKMIDATITPQNRIILCRPITMRTTTATTTTTAAVAKAHARMEIAYRKAHYKSTTSSASDNNSPAEKANDDDSSNQETNASQHNVHHYYYGSGVHLPSLSIGVALGAMITAIAASFRPRQI